MSQIESTSQVESGQSNEPQTQQVDNNQSNQFQQVETQSAPPSPQVEQAPYAFQSPSHYSDSDKTEISLLAEQLGMTSPEQSQKLVNLFEQGKRDQSDFVSKQVNTWDSELRADADFGGANFDSNVAEANAGLKSFDPSGEVSKMLHDTGYGSNPTIVKAFQRMGKMLNNDTLVGNTHGQSNTPLHDRLYK